MQLRESRNGERCRELYFQDSSVVLGYPRHVDREFELQNDDMIYYTNSMAGCGKHAICTFTLFHGLKKSLFSRGTNSLFTPLLELNQFTLAENLTPCFQIIHLPLPHRAWQLGKGIFKLYILFSKLGH